MQRSTTDLQLQEIADRALEHNVNWQVTTTRDGERFTIFEDWKDVETVGDIVQSMIPGMDNDTRDSIPTFEHCQYPVDRRHHIEWAIGEYGFSDQWQTCSHCYTAIDTTDPWPRYYWDTDSGDLVCFDCLQANPDFQSDYLAYCARHLGDDLEVIKVSVCDPRDHGFVCLNNGSTDFDATSPGWDHAEWRKALNTANHDDLRRLARAIQLVDDNIQIVISWGKYSGGEYVYWAKFENPPFDDSDYQEYPPEVAREVLWYAIGIVLRKWASLTSKGK